MIIPVLRFHPSARNEFREAARWYEREREGLGDDFYQAVDQAIQRVACGEMPGIPSGKRGGGRMVYKVLLRRFPYAVYFELNEDECVVWAVAHGKRKPGYWHSRL